MLHSSSDSDFDEEDVDIVRRQRIFRPRINFDRNPVENLSRFRLTNEHVTFLVENLAQFIEHPTNRNFALSAEQQIRLSLRYLATNGNFQLVGDAHGVHKSTVCRALRKFVDVVNDKLVKRFIRWPENLRHVSNEFYKIANLPCVIGCVDGSHFEIIRPISDENQYVNRHGVHSINGMLVCGPDLKFYYASAKWPGSVNDARVFRTSLLAQRLANNTEPFKAGTLKF